MYKKVKTRYLSGFKRHMVKTSGLEPPTPCMSSRYSNQLSYAFTEKALNHPAGEPDSAPVAAELGFEPRQTESESAVLPLHNSAMLYWQKPDINNTIIYNFARLSIEKSGFFKFVKKHLHFCACCVIISQ